MSECYRHNRQQGDICQGCLDALRADLARVTAERDEARAEIARIHQHHVHGPAVHETWDTIEKARDCLRWCAAVNLAQAQQLGDIRTQRDAAEALLLAVVEGRAFFPEMRALLRKRGVIPAE